MKKYPALLCLLFIPAFALAQTHPFIGYKFIAGDTAWFSTVLATTTNISITNGGKLSKTRMEQAVFHHQFTTQHTDSAVVMVTVFDSIRIVYGSDSIAINYNSNNKADSLAAYNMMVYPLKALLGHPLTVFINAKGKIDSVQGLESVVHDASARLSRSEQIEELRKVLSPDMIADMLDQALGNLPNIPMAQDSPVKYTRARMVGRTQFIDDVGTTLVAATKDTAWLIRDTYTRIASPTINYAGKRCVIDSTWGTGNQRILFDIPHGVMLESHDQFSNYLRAAISGTKDSVIQTNELAADVVMTRYAEKSTVSKKAVKKKK